MTMKTRAAVAIAMLASLAAIAVWGFTRDSAPAPAAATATPSLEPTAIETSEDEPDPTLAEPDDGPDLPLPTGRDWVDVMQKIINVQTAAFERRDQTLINDVFHPRCDCRGPLVESILEARRQGFRFDYGQPIVVSAFEYVREDSTLINLEVEIEIPASTVTNRDGTLRDERSATTSYTRWTIASGLADDSDHWLVIHREVITGPSR